MLISIKKHLIMTSSLRRGRFHCLFVCKSYLMNGRALLTYRAIFLGVDFEIEILRVIEPVNVILLQWGTMQHVLYACTNMHSSYRLFRAISVYVMLNFSYTYLNVVRLCVRPYVKVPTCAFPNIALMNTDLKGLCRQCVL